MTAIHTGWATGVDNRVTCSYHCGIVSANGYNCSLLEDQYLWHLYEYMRGEFVAIEQAKIPTGNGKPYFWIYNLHGRNIVVSIDMVEAAVVCHSGSPVATSFVLDLGHPKCFERAVEWMWGLRENG